MSSWIKTKNTKPEYDVKVLGLCGSDPVIARRLERVKGKDWWQINGKIGPDQEPDYWQPINVKTDQ